MIRFAFGPISSSWSVFEKLLKRTRAIRSDIMVQSLQSHQQFELILTHLINELTDIQQQRLFISLCTCYSSTTYVSPGTLPPPPSGGLHIILLPAESAAAGRRAHKFIPTKSGKLTWNFQETADLLRGSIARIAG